MDPESSFTRFGESTGLKVNYAKTVMVPINITQSKLQHLALTFGCDMGSLPFTYLGLPMGLSKPKAIDFSPMVSRCERRLAATSAMLNQAGRLEVTNSVLSALPTFGMSTFLLQQSVIIRLTSSGKFAFGEVVTSMPSRDLKHPGQWSVERRKKEGQVC